MPGPRLTYLTLSLLLISTGLVAETTGDSTVVVKEVDLVGNHRISSERIRFLLQVRADKTYTLRDLQQAIDDDVRSINTMGAFAPDVKAEETHSDDGTQVTVTYRFHELPYVTAVSYEGLGYFDEEKAAKVVAIKPGGWLNAILLESDRRAIQRVFQEDGNRWCTVTVETRAVSGNTSVIFHVGLGQEIKVGLVLYEGLPDGARPLVLDRALLMQVDTAYQPELVEIDRGAVARKLQDLGWLDARVVEVRRETFDYVRPVEARARHGPGLAPDDFYNDRVVLTYYIVPGARYRLGKVSFVGNTVATQEQMLEAFAMPTGSWFIRDDLEGEPRPGGNKGAIERARRVISNQGYAQARLYPDRSLDLKNHIVDLTLHVAEGRIYHIGRVDVSGNEHTRDAVVRRAMFLHPGDLWNDDRRDESLEQVRRTGVFKATPPSPPEIDPSFPTDRPDQTDLTVAVQEDSTGSLNFQIGYSTATKIFGTVGYTERNFDLLGLLTGGIDHFRGANQNISLQITISQPAKAISLTFFNPHLFDGPYTFEMRASRENSTLNSWAERRIDLGSTVGRNFLDNHLNLSVGYLYSDIKIDEVALDAPDDAVSGDYYLQTVNLGQSYDRLKPDRNYPTDGYLLSANEGLTGLVLPSSAEYYEYSLKGTRYVPLATSEDGGVTYIHASGIWRQEVPFGESATIPFYERYRGGGQAPRHRGFDYDDLSPQEINHNGELARTGGTKDTLFTVELSFPVQGTNEGVRAIAFTDVGNVWAQDAQVDYRDLRTAVGFGIRFPIQIPVALDFAWLVNPGFNESRTHVQFGLGNVSF